MLVLMLVLEECNQSGRRCCMWDRALVLKKGRHDPCIDEPRLARRPAARRCFPCRQSPCHSHCHEECTRRPVHSHRSVVGRRMDGWMDGEGSLLCRTNRSRTTTHSKNPQRLVMPPGKTAAHTSCHICGARVASRRQHRYSTYTLVHGWICQIGGILLANRPPPLGHPSRRSPAEPSPLVAHCRFRRRNSHSEAVRPQLTGAGPVRLRTTYPLWDQPSQTMLRTRLLRGSLRLLADNLSLARRRPAS
jgi:hypothetical protein